MNYNMRWMTQKDITSVLSIQDADFNSLKYDKKFFSSIVKSRKQSGYNLNIKNSFIAYVCELEKKVVGYIVYKVSVLNFDLNLHSEKMNSWSKKNKGNFFPMSGEIVSFCVDQDLRFKGVGNFLISSLIERFSSVVELSLKEAFTRPFLIYATISDRDIGPHLFFSKMGFKAKSISWNAFGTDHDGYNFVYEKTPIVKRSRKKSSV